MLRQSNEKFTKKRENRRNQKKKCVVFKECGVFIGEKRKSIKEEQKKQTDHPAVEAISLTLFRYISSFFILLWQINKTHKYYNSFHLVNVVSICIRWTQPLYTSTKPLFLSDRNCGCVFNTKFKIKNKGKKNTKT